MIVFYIMSRRNKCSYFLFFILFCIVSTAANVEFGTHRSKPSKPIANGTIITTRFGNDSFPKEQCQCINFWLCDADEVFEDPNDPNPCGHDLTCCKLPILIPSESSVKPDLPSCSEGVCVDSSQCKNYGAGKIDFRISSCPEKKLCCPLSDVVTTEAIPSGQLPTGHSVSSNTDKSPVVSSGTESPKSDCLCVPASRCINYGQGVLQMRISNCVENEVCCNPADVLVQPTVEIPNSTSKYACGYKKGDPLSTRIANIESNDVAEFGEFPWMSLILKKHVDREELVCGASLLAPRWLLTAAHCIDKINKDLLIVRVGEYDTYLPSEYEPGPHEDGYVADIYTPANYRSDVAFNDLALIKMKQPFKLRENVVPICSPVFGSEFGNADIYDPSRCLATGWGKDAYNKDAQYSKILKKVDLFIVPKDQCQHALRKTRLGSTFNLHDSFICAGGQPGKDTCKGDGGGPLICALRSEPTRYVLVGVTSWGIDCAKNYPGVYASLFHNKDWLLTEWNLRSIFERR